METSAGNIKRIICLANSRKYNGRCVAGREIVDKSPGDWVRPVSLRQYQELAPSECRYEDGSIPQLLDIIDIGVGSRAPHRHQNENWLMLPGIPWRKFGKCSIASLERIQVTRGPLWFNGVDSKNGKNNRIPVALEPLIGDSLKLIRVSALDLTVIVPEDPFGEERPSLRATFAFDSIWYRLSVTDDALENAYFPQGAGSYKLGPHYLTISVGEEFNGHFYKLVAAAIEVK